MMQTQTTQTMFNTTEQQAQDSTLEGILDNMQAGLDQFEQTMWEVFHDASELSPYQKQRIADKALKAAGLDNRSEKTYEQWGVFACETEAQIHAIIDEYLQYRHDKATGAL